MRFLSDKATSLQEQILQDQGLADKAFTDVEVLEKEKDSAEKILKEIDLNLKDLAVERDDQKDKLKLMVQTPRNKLRLAVIKSKNNLG